MTASAVKSGYVFNQGDPLNYLEWGSPDAPVVVLIHGARGVAYSWRPTAQRLADRYRCIAINLHGHGDSSPSAQRQYTPALYVSDVQALADQLDLRRFTIIGFSMGGNMAIAYAAAHPEQVQALVIVDAGVGLSEERAWAMKRAVEATPLEFDSWEDAVAFTQRSHPGWSPALLEERAPYTFQRLPSGKVTWKYDLVFHEEWLGPDLPPRIRARPSGPNPLERVQCPMLVLKAEADNQLTVEQCEQMVRYGRNSRWVEIPGTTHYIHEDNFEGFLKEVEPFLAEVAPVPVR